MELFNFGVKIHIFKYIFILYLIKEMKQVDKTSKMGNKIASPVQETQKRLDERNRRVVTLEEERERERCHVKRTKSADASRSSLEK